MSARIALRTVEDGGGAGKGCPSECTPLDDVVVNDVSMFRAEQMDDNDWWFCCYLNGGDERITQLEQVVMELFEEVNQLRQQLDEIKNSTP